MTPEATSQINLAIRNGIDSVNANLDAKLDGRLAALKSEVLRHVNELTARPPAAFVGAPAHDSQPLLGGDTQFRDWLKGPRGQKSSYATSFPGFKLEHKALLNVGGTAHVDGVHGAPATPLRLVQLIPVVPMNAGGGGRIRKRNQLRSERGPPGRRAIESRVNSGTDEYALLHQNSRNDFARLNAIVKRYTGSSFLAGQQVAARRATESRGLELERAASRWASSERATPCASVYARSGEHATRHACRSSRAACLVESQCRRRGVIRPPMRWLRDY